MKMINSLVLLVVVLFTGSAFATPDIDLGSQAEAPLASEAVSSRPGTYYDWGQGRDGWGYCYQWNRRGDVLNGGMPVDEYNCESRRPSNFNWARSAYGWGNCYRFSPNGLVLNRGQAQSYYNCERFNPSYFNWARATNGYVYCFQFGNGLVLNEGRAVPNNYCY